MDKGDDLLVRYHNLIFELSVSEPSERTSMIDKDTAPVEEIRSLISLPDQEAVSN